MGDDRYPTASQDGTPADRQFGAVGQPQHHPVPGCNAQCHQAYRDSDLSRMLEAAGLAGVAFYPPIAGISQRYEFPLCLARKPGPGA